MADSGCEWFELALPLLSLFVCLFLCLFLPERLRVCGGRRCGCCVVGSYCSAESEPCVVTFRIGGAIRSVDADGGGRACGHACRSREGARHQEDHSGGHRARLGQQ
eukprot:1260671-Pyramimonas_sp.AAC.1